MIRWFGERQPGWIADYERRWMDTSYYCTVRDPVYVATGFREYPSWEAMPGAGLCGIVIEKAR